MTSKCIFLIVFAFILSNCLEKFDFERPESLRGAVAVQGKLVKGNPSKVEVILKDVFDFYNSPKFITARKVFLIDENGNELELKTRKQGFYNIEIPKDHPFFKVEYGGKYKIKIDGLKGQDYESDYDELFPTPIPDDFYVEETTLEVINQTRQPQTFDQLNFYISTPLKAAGQSQNSRIVWELNGVSKVTATDCLLML